MLELEGRLDGLKLVTFPTSRLFTICDPPDEVPIETLYPSGFPLAAGHVSVTLVDETVDPAVGLDNWVQNGGLSPGKVEKLISSQPEASPFVLNGIIVTWIVEPLGIPPGWKLVTSPTLTSSLISLSPGEVPIVTLYPVGSPSAASHDNVRLVAETEDPARGAESSVQSGALSLLQPSFWTTYGIKRTRNTGNREVRPKGIRFFGAKLFIVVGV